jgi:nucleotide-binding universal stress UspA family protein
MNADTGINTILVPLDGSEYAERALPWAKALAGDTATLVLLEVTPHAHEVRGFQGQVVGTAEFVESTYQDLATDRLNVAREKWFSGREGVNLVVAEGDPAGQIMATADTQKADMIVMSSHGRGAIGRFVSGSVADRVVRHAPLPVMIVGPEGTIEPEQRISRVVAPIDGSELSLRALPVAASITKQTGAGIAVINVVSPTSGDLPLVASGMEPMSATTYELVYDEEVRESQELVDRAVTALQGLGVQAEGKVFTGAITESILNALNPGDVLVISSHGRKGMARWVLGSTAMKLVRSGQAPVVVVTREYLEQAGA